MAQMKTPVLRAGSNRGSECVDATKHNSPNNTTATLTFQACRGRRWLALAKAAAAEAVYFAVIWLGGYLAGGGWK